MNQRAPSLSNLALPAHCWQAQLRLGFTGGGRGTRLGERIHSGPLRVQKPLYPEGAQTCHAVIVHPPGDVADGEKIPRKGGPGITRSDLLVINKTDLAPHVGANLEVMRTDAARMRGARPFVFTSLRDGSGVDDIVAFIRHQGLLDAAHTNHQPEEL
jgi:hypothetical protein